MLNPILNLFKKINTLTKDKGANWAATLRENTGKIFENIGEIVTSEYLNTIKGLYARLNNEQKLELFRYLGIELEIDPGKSDYAELIKSAAVFKNDFDLLKQSTVSNLLLLRNGMESPRQTLLRQFINIEGGIKFLVDMRVDLLLLMKNNPDLYFLELIDNDLLHLFNSWFNFGSLELVPIDWNKTPAAQLEKLMRYEVVHPMSEWNDLRNRLDLDRLCYAFYHPHMPAEPLIFVEVALARKILRSINELFSRKRELSHVEEAYTAVFYSINNPQKGLSGINLGNSLIKMVVRELQAKYPHLARFVTLSPIPGFRPHYLEPLLMDQKKFSLDKTGLENFFSVKSRKSIVELSKEKNFPNGLLKILSDNQWIADRKISEMIQPGLQKTVKYYLISEKKNGKPLDPVANFHYRNGAYLYDINFASNTSNKGLEESYGFTVNYYYDLKEVENTQRKFRKGEILISKQVEKI